MREDHFEQLEKMFPRGFMIMVVSLDGDIRMTMSNPEKVRLMDEWCQVLMKSQGT